MKAKDRIAKYSAFAISFIAMKNVNAEVAYFDIDPDTIISLDNEHYYLDINIDGTPDFHFFKANGTVSSYWGSNFSYSQFLFIAPDNTLNSVAAIKSVIDPSYGGFTQYFPYALSNGAFVNDLLNFQNADFQILAYSREGPSGAIGGLWYGGAENHFIGVHFKDEDNCAHFGWIRCDINVTNDSLIIKDFAYESKCDVGIAAGDMTGDSTLAVSNTNVLPASVFCYNNEITIQLNAPMHNARVVITNMEGSIVYEKKLTDQSSQIQLDEPQGIYIVEITNGIDSFSKKIVIQ